MYVLQKWCVEYQVWVTQAAADGLVYAYLTREQAEKAAYSIGLYSEVQINYSETLGGYPNDSTLGMWWRVKSVQ